ncbi:hypothetical protein WN943_001806 [Citrus x changshan-huyou]
MGITTEARGKSKESCIPFFSLASISAATDNFSMENKLGEGGFGPVYNCRCSSLNIWFDVATDPANKGRLGWGTRIRIVEGIAQGLLYLHQYFR